MDQSRMAETLFRLEHRHNDGSWGTLEPRPLDHDPSSRDPEGGWAEGEVYECRSCEELVRVRYPTAGAHLEPR